MYRAIGLLPSLLLAACTQDSDLVRTGKFLFTTATTTSEKIPRERAAAIPYATMGMELGSSAQALLILGTTTADERDWFSGENVFVRTRHGQVIRTVGLPYDLGGLRAVSAGAAALDSRENLYSFDFPDLGVFGAIAHCARRAIGDETIEIFGAPIATHHIAEHCEVPTLRWRFDNDFWEDRMSGYVWRSAQHIHPKASVLTLEVFRPEQTAAK